MASKSYSDGFPTSISFKPDMLVRLRREAKQLGIPMATHIKSIIVQHWGRLDRARKKKPDEAA